MKLRERRLDPAEREALLRYSLQVPAGADTATPAVRELRGYLGRLGRAERLPAWVIAAHARLRCGGACVEEAVAEILRQIGEPQRPSAAADGQERPSTPAL